MIASNLFPRFYTPSSDEALSASEKIDLEGIKTLRKMHKPIPLAVNFNGTNIFAGRATFEAPSHDFKRVTKAIDGDSYVLQAFAKYQELFWKEGWTLASENPEAKDYIYRRIDVMEPMMNKPFQEFLYEVADQLVKYHNVFLTKVRKDISPYVDLSRSRLQDKTVASYGIIPTEQTEIKRDKYNNPVRYRQRIEDSYVLNAFFGRSKQTNPTWKAEDVVHMYRRRKPGHAFGSPFLTAAIEDVVSLRQLEEDILNLIHRELFPLYVYKVGNDKMIPTPEQLDAAQFEIEGMRTEGGAIIPGINDIDVLGADGNALKADGYLSSFKERVAIGLGIFPHHLGMSGESGNRSMTDRLDTMLYDKIKEYQRYFAEAMRMYIFNEMLLEGGFDPYNSKSKKGVSDVVEFKFNEIDVDTKVKKENHVLSLWTGNLITSQEARIELKMDPEFDEAETYAALQARMGPDQVVTNGPTGGSTRVDTTPAPAQKAVSQKGKSNAKKGGKGASNVVRPSNQHGTRTSPNIRRDDSNKTLLDVAELLASYEDDNID